MFGYERASEGDGGSDTEGSVAAKITMQTNLLEISQFVIIERKAIPVEAQKGILIPHQRSHQNLRAELRTYGAHDGLHVSAC